MTKRSIDEVYAGIDLFDINQDNLNINNNSYIYNNVNDNQTLMDLKDKIKILENTIEDITVKKELYKKKLYQSYRLYNHQKRTFRYSNDNNLKLQ